MRGGEMRCDGAEENEGSREGGLRNMGWKTLAGG